MHFIKWSCAWGGRITREPKDPAKPRSHTFWVLNLLCALTSQNPSIMCSGAQGTCMYVPWTWTSDMNIWSIFPGSWFPCQVGEDSHHLKGSYPRHPIMVFVGARRGQAGWHWEYCPKKGLLVWRVIRVFNFHDLNDLDRPISVDHHFTYPSFTRPSL